MGKRKIAIEKIEDKQRRNVTFTKRREGLFKKAQTACQKFGLQIGIVVFSPAGRPFTFSNSSSVSVDAIIDGYISTSSSSPSSSSAVVMGNKRSSRSDGDDDDDVQVIEPQKKKRKTTMNAAVVTPCITTVQEEEEEEEEILDEEVIEPQYKYVDSDQTHVQELIYELMGSSRENNNAGIVTEEITMDQSSQFLVEGDSYTWAPDVQEIINLEDFEYADHHHHHSDETTMGLIPPPPHTSTSLCNISTSSSDMNEEEEEVGGSDEDYGYTLEEWEQILSSTSHTSVVDNSTLSPYMHQEVVPADWPTEDFLHLLCS